MIFEPITIIKGNDTGFAVPLYVTIPDGAGMDVLATNGEDQVTAVVDNTNLVKFTLPSAGLWTVYVSENGELKNFKEIEIAADYSIVINPNESKLPDGYQQLEYIQILNTASAGLTISPLKSGYVIQMDVRFDFNVPTSTSYQYYTTILGRRDASIRNSTVTNKYYGVYFVGNELWTYNSAAKTRLKFTYPNPTERHVLYLDNYNGIAKVDEIEMPVTIVDTGTGMISSLSVCYDSPIQTVTGSKGNSNGAITLWGLKVFDADGVPVLNKIPALRESDNKIGWYDTITDLFQAGGTSVVAGPAV